jgi:general secretion pathway protein A
VAEYIYHRLKIAGLQREIFDGKAINRISASSEGIPRKINNICEIALLQGMFEKKAVIDETLINKVIEDLPL